MKRKMASGKGFVKATAAPGQCHGRRKALAHAIAVVCAGGPLLAGSALVHAGSGLPKASKDWLQSGSASLSVANRALTITQNSQRAILNWDSFNIDAGNTVQFNQPSVNSTALNRIFDSAPSQIFGALKANGNVYLINPNGILFGSSAQVNVHTLLASTSTLDINDNLYKNSSLYDAIQSGEPALTGLGANPNASITLQSGAQINTDSYGQVLVFAPHITNAGSISTPDGQSVLAASKDSVYIASTGASSDLRGMLVEVNTGGDVNNLGEIIADRGNISLVGMAINQSGRLRASTSVDVNGSIRIIARDTTKLISPDSSASSVLNKSLLVDDPSLIRSTNSYVVGATRTGTVTFGANSVTEVVPDESTASETASGAQPQPTSRIDVVGNTIDIQNNSQIVAKGGGIRFFATPQGDDLYSANADSTHSGYIHIGDNALIDTSGENVSLPMSRHTVDVQLLGSQLKDAPLQRDGILKGATVTVDITKGSPLIADDDWQAALQGIQKTVKERLTAGGSISLNSTGSVVMGNNATLDVSGGSVSYESGYEATTKLFARGRIIDIGVADPNLLYNAVFDVHTITHPKWGPTVVGRNTLFTRGTYRQGFTEGSAGGALTITGSALYGLDLANIRAGATVGAYQRDQADAPLGGSIEIALGGFSQSTAVVQNVAIAQTMRSLEKQVGDAITDADGNLLDLNIAADKLNASHFGSFTLSANGTITVEKGSALDLTPFAKVSLTGTGIDLEGRIRAPGGSISLATDKPLAATTHDGNFPIVLGAGSVLDVSGSWTNDYLTTHAGVLPAGGLALDGGDISIAALGDVSVDANAHIKANGGAQLTSTGDLNGGDGGDIAVGEVHNSDETQQNTRTLTLDGELSAYGFNDNGSLTITAPDIQFGGSAADKAHPETLVLGPDFFARGAFADYIFKSNVYGIDVEPGTELVLRQRNRVFSSNLNNLYQLASDAALYRVGIVQDIPDYLRAPTSITFNTAKSATSNYDAGTLTGRGRISIGEGAYIGTDPGGGITLDAIEPIYIDGTLEAPGGDISITLNTDAGSYDPARAIWLDADARLLARAARVATPNPRGYRYGTILDAGSVTLSAASGAIVMAPGSLIDVSGASYWQDYAGRFELMRSPVTSQLVNAAAGSISLTAAESLALYGSLRGAASGDGLGGTLSLYLDSNDRSDPAQGDVTLSNSTFPYTALAIQVFDTLPTLSTALQYGEALPTELQRHGWIGVDSVAQGGFANLTLGAANVKGRVNTSTKGADGLVEFMDDVNLNLSGALTFDTTDLLLDDHRVDLSAASVYVGQDDRNTVEQLTQTNTAGSGSLTLAGQFFELSGNVDISGAADVLLKSAGDLRLRTLVEDKSGTAARQLQPGTFTSSGNLTLQAAQIYPSTLSDYTIEVTDPDGVFAAIGSGGARTPILSAGGKLTVLAPSIDIGVGGDSPVALAAPLGQIIVGDADTQSIHLGAYGTLDVSAHDQTILYGQLLGGDIGWTYPISAALPLQIDAPPEKRVELTAQAIATDAGSTIDLSGGGDIYAYENVPGNGGSVDFLDAAYADGAFAVVPALQSPVTPYDTVEMTDAGIKAGTIVHLEAASGLPAGDYAVLPAHYALLPGAYLITPTGTTVLPGQTGYRADGTAIVSGRFGTAFTGQYASQYQGFLVETGDMVRLRSKYNEATGSEFFSGQGVGAAADAGSLVLDVGDQLRLNGAIGAAAQEGRRAQLDIVADVIEVVNQTDATASGTGGVQVSASELSALGVDSILLGGRRTHADTTTTIDVGSSRVSVDSGAQLSAPDIILAARDSVSVAQGARIAASGDSSVTATEYDLSGDGALLRVSNAAQADSVRTDVTGASGSLAIAAGATLTGNAVLMDATQNLSTKGTLQLDGGSLNLTANRVSLGDGSGSADGVAFSNADLAAMNAGTLRLSSRSSIDFYGGVNLVNDRVEFNAGTLRNTQGGDVTVQAANTLALDNAAHVAADAAPAAGGRLTLAAADIELGSDKSAGGTLAVNGFDAVQLGAAGLTQQLLGVGNFTLAAGADDAAHVTGLSVRADSIAGAAGANTAITATGGVTLAAAGADSTAQKAAAGTSAQATAPTSGLGAELTVTGKSVTQATHIDLASGKLTLTATGADAGDDVTLAAGSLTDVSGRTIVFPHDEIDTDGGEIHLQSQYGNVVAQSGASVKIDGGANGGNAGSLFVSAAANATDHRGAILWDANAGLSGVAAAGYNGGSIDLDAGALSSADVNAWLALSAGAGIDNSIALRSRSGDIVIDTDAAANSLSVSADSGSVTLNSHIDASGADGGGVALYAGKNLTLSGSARIDAIATGTDGRGGRVELGAGKTGTLAFAAGSAIDVSGNGDGRDGVVKLRAPRSDGNDSVAVSDNGVSVQGAERIDLDAYETYGGTVLDTALLNKMKSDATTFMSHESAIKSALGALGAQDNFHLRPEMEVDSSGDLALSQELDLSTWRFGANDEAGVLTLRAAGNLTISQSLHDGYVNADLSNYATTTYLAVVRYYSGITDPLPLLMSGSATDYRLVAGADLSAAAPNTVEAGLGNINVTSGADIITGAGDVALFAGNNVTVDMADSVIASLGATDYREYQMPDDYSGPFGLPGGATELLPDVGTVATGGDSSEWAYILFAADGLNYLQYPHSGGDVSIAAGGSVDFAETTSFFSDWIHRFGGTIDPSSLFSGSYDKLNVTTWGISLADLQQGIAALGGGNLSVKAGGDITNLNAAVPTTATAMAGGDYQTQVIGGGNLDVQAGGNITSPRILVDKGTAELDAGGYIGAADSGDLNTIIALADTQVNLQAGGDITIDAVFNSTVMPLTKAQSGGSEVFYYDNYFFTYTDAASLSVASTSGDITFNNDSAAVTDAFSSKFPDSRQIGGSNYGQFGSYSEDTRHETRVLVDYPATLRAIAASGDINLNNSLYLFPSPTGQLTLLANGSIATASAAADTGGSAGALVIQADTPRDLLPSITNPASTLAQQNTNISLTLIGLLDNSHVFLTDPIHVDDTQANVVASLNGDIGSENPIQFNLPKQSWFYAGRDIENLTLNVQHSRDNEISEVVAGRDIFYPLQFKSDGSLADNTQKHIRVDGPGALDIVAGGDVEFGNSSGVESEGNLQNSVLPDNGADVTILAGTKLDTSALGSASLYTQFADTYLGVPTTLSGSYIDWFAAGNYTGTDIGSLVSVFTGEKYSDRDAALTAFAKLPVLTQQAIALEAYRTQRFNTLTSAGSQSAYADAGGFSGSYDYAADMVDFVSFDRFAGDLTAAYHAVTGASVASNADAAAAIALLPAAQQQQIARLAIDNATPLARRELLVGVMNTELQLASVEQSAGYIVDGNRDGNGRGFSVLGALFPENPDAAGDISLVFSKVYTYGDGDINLLTPYGQMDLGVAGQFAGVDKEADQLGVVAQRYGAVSAVADGSININQSRIFSLDGGPITLWSSYGDIDAGNGAKTALSIQPPTAQLVQVGNTKVLQLVFPAAISGSGVKTAVIPHTATDPGPLVADASVGADTRTQRQRFYRSLTPGGAYISVPNGVIDAGEAGIQLAGNGFFNGTIVNAYNVSVGGVSVGLPATTAIAAGTLGLGDTAASATKNATSSMNSALEQATSALSEATAFVTVDIIGISQ